MLAADPAQIETVLTGGDDYEIVCTVPPDKLASFRAAAAAAGVPVAEIGRVAGGPTGRRGSSTATASHRLFKRTSFSHF